MRDADAEQRPLRVALGCLLRQNEAHAGCYQIPWAIPGAPTIFRGWARFSAHSKYRIRIDNDWLPGILIAPALAGTLNRQVGNELTLIVMNGNLLAFELGGSAFGTDMDVVGVERSAMLVLGALGLACLAAFGITREPAPLVPAVVTLLWARALWRTLAVKDAALCVPNVTIVTRGRPDWDDLGSHF